VEVSYVSDNGGNNAQGGDFWQTGSIEQAAIAGIASHGELQMVYLDDDTPIMVVRCRGRQDDAYLQVHSGWQAILWLTGGQPSSILNL
jgi:hypothetical protein